MPTGLPASPSLADTASQDDLGLVTQVRPQNFQEVVGQQQLKARLLTALRAARSRHEHLDHTLVWGPPGTGKSTIASLLGEAGVLHGSFLRTPADLLTGLTRLQLMSQHGMPEFVLIEEAHGTSTRVLEALYTYIDTHTLGADTFPHTTIILLTTQPAMLPEPLRDRMGVQLETGYLTTEQLEQLVRQSSAKLRMSVEQQVGQHIGQRSRGVPRIANRLLARVRDVAGDHVSNQQALRALAFWGIDQYGLGDHDRRYLDVLRNHHGNPVGLSTVSQSLGTDNTTIQQLIEPYLIRAGFIEITPRGRVLRRRTW